MREEKKNLEELMLDLVSEFEKLTDIRVVSVGVRRTHMIDGSSELYSVEAECEI